MIIGDGKVIGTNSVKLGTAAEARVYVKLSAKNKKSAKKAKTVRYALDLVDAKGNVILSVRDSAKSPLGK